MKKKNIGKFEAKSFVKKTLVLALAVSTVFSTVAFVGLPENENASADARLVETSVADSSATMVDTSSVIRENVPSSDVKVENLVAVNKKAVKVSVTADGKKKTVYTSKPNVGALLEEMGIYLSEKDEINYSKKTAIKDNMNIVIVRVDTIKKYKTEIIKYNSVKKDNASMLKGTSKVTKSGTNGQKQIWYEVVMKNGKVVSNDVLSEKVVKSPVNKITEVGTKIPENTISRNGKTYKYKKVINVTATAYDPSVGNITATGLRPAVGRIAVDPRVIPLHTKMFIESPDGSWTYGYAVAEDTGGAIKGNKIDLFYNTYRECVNFGVRKAKVYILE